MKDLYFVISIVLLLGLCTQGQSFGEAASNQVLVVHYQFSKMITSGKNVYVFYQQNGPLHNYLRESYDGGKNFGPAIDLGSSIQPVVAVSGSNVYMAWDTGFTGWPPSHVMFAKSTDFGKTFSKPQSLYNDTNSSGIVTQLLADGSHVFAVIDELGEIEPYKADVYLRASSDNGTTWAKEVELLPAPINNGNPLGFDVSIQKSGNDIFVAGEYPLFRKSTDLGMTFGATRDVIRASNPSDLQMVASGDNVYLTYTALAQYGQAVFLTSSNDGGDTFGLPKRLSQEMGEAEDPQITADGNNLYAMWKFDNSNVLKGIKSSGGPPFSPVSGIFFAKSVDGGKTFSIPFKIAGDVSASSCRVLSCGQTACTSLSYLV